MSQKPPKDEVSGANEYRTAGIPDEALGTIHIGTRVSKEIVERINRFGRRASKPGMAIKRAMALRMLIVAGLKALEQEQKG